MDNMQDDNALSRKRDQRAAATASSIIQSSDENPDEVADNLNFAREFSKRTGSPLPPIPLVRENRDVFQRIMDESRNKALLSTARKTATWYGENPMAVLLAKDDVYNLCSLEQATQRFWEASKGAPAPNAELIAARAQAAPPPATQPAEPASAPLVGSTSPDTSPIAPNESTVPATDDDAQIPAEGSIKSFSHQIPPTVPASKLPAAGDVPPGPNEALTDDEKNTEQLIVDIGNARNASAEQFAALEERVRTHEWIDPGTAIFYLKAVREGKATADDVRIYLSSRYSKYRVKSVGQSLLELPKGALGNGIASLGKTMEFAGQMMDGPELPGRQACRQNHSSGHPAT